MMKIVVLDGYALNPGDLSWDELRKLGNVEIYERTPKELITERAGGAEIIMTNKTVLTSKIIKKLTSLKYIGVLATGVNVVDLEAASERGVIVTNVPAYSTMSVAQHVFALILEYYNYTGTLSEEVKAGKWSGNADFCFWDKQLTELAGKTIGIIGFGRIGKAVAGIADAFGMKVVISSKRKAPGYKNYSVEELLNKSDIVTLHCPLTEETRGLINADRLKQMKSTALLVNTSRGPVVVEEDLADALNKDIIAGAALDVLSEEPPRPDNPLLTAKNCIITPHIAWATFEARQRLMKISVENLKGFLNGKPVNVVN